MKTTEKELNWVAKGIGVSIAAVFLSTWFGFGTANAQGNTNVGTGSLANITTGIDDSAFGFDSMTDTTTGSDNTASGAEAL